LSDIEFDVNIGINGKRVVLTSSDGVQVVHSRKNQSSNAKVIEEAKRQYDQVRYAQPRTEFMLEKLSRNLFPYVQNVYSNGSIYRKDYNIRVSTANTYLETLQSNWPNIVDDNYRRANNNLVAAYSSAKSPYNSSDIISYYDMQVPPDETKLRFGLPTTHNIGGQRFYGLKFNQSSNTVSAKFFYTATEYKECYPDLYLKITRALTPFLGVPSGDENSVIYFGVTHTDDGVDSYEGRYVDAYVLLSPRSIREYCSQEPDLTFPYGNEVNDLHVQQFGISYDMETETFRDVKAYVEDWDNWVGANSLSAIPTE
jgi:hypothetical protein